MWDRISIRTGPESLPVSLNDAKARILIDHSDQDDEITAMINDAVKRIDGPNAAGIAMMEQTWRYALDEFPSEIILPGWPVKSVSSVKYLDPDGIEQTVSTDTYRFVSDIHPPRLVLKKGQSWPVPQSSRAVVYVDYVLGEASAADVPADLKSAIYLYVGHRFESREAISDRPMTEVPMGFNDVINEYRQAWAAG